MANLRTLLYTGAATISSASLLEFAVGNTSQSASNGGCCCLWTVPTGASYVRFEMWGGGGGGGGSCCCMAGWSGGSGSYAVRTLSGTQVVPGTQYTICAGGTSAVSNTNDGCPGNTSYVTGSNLSNFCARGGCGGYAFCYGFCSTCYNYQQCSNVCCATGGDICISGTCGARYTEFYCYNGSQQWAPVAPATVSGPVFGPNGCTPYVGIGDGAICLPVYPGGGGFSAQVHSGVCRCGHWGAAGLVLVTYG
jgi:hypothetical protein